MGEAIAVQPDHAFLRRVLASGGGDLKKCYQCATCSVACELSGEESPFPRKQMLAAQWGLKDRLVSDPAVWLCHNCGECTERCPRGARPSDVLGAVRREVIRQFAFPRFLGSLVASPKALAAAVSSARADLRRRTALGAQARAGRPIRIRQPVPGKRAGATVLRHLRIRSAGIWGGSCAVRPRTARIRQAKEWRAGCRMP